MQPRLLITFDAKEFGSNTPYLQITTQASGKCTHSDPGAILLPLLGR